MPLPRVHRLRFTRRYFEEQRIEFRNARKASHPFPVRLLLIERGISIKIAPIKAFRRNLLHRVPALRKDLPHLINVSSLWKTSAHTNDGNRLIPSWPGLFFTRPGA